MSKEIERWRDEARGQLSMWLRSIVKYENVLQGQCWDIPHILNNRKEKKGGQTKEYKTVPQHRLLYASPPLCFLSFFCLFLHSFIDIAIKYIRQEEKTNIHVLISHPHICWRAKRASILMQKSTLTPFITVHISEYRYCSIHVFHTMTCIFCHNLKRITHWLPKKKKEKKINCVVYLHLFCNGQENSCFILWAFPDKGMLRCIIRMAR